MFWNRMDKRVSKGLYNGYTEIFPLSETTGAGDVIPQCGTLQQRFRDEGALFRAAPCSSISLRSERKRSDLLVAEIETVLKLQ